MAWTSDDTAFLRSFKGVVDCDDIKIKEQIKKKLLNNRYIIHVLNNDKLDEDEPDTYFGVNILPYYMIEPTQHNVQNYVCFTVNYDELDRYNKAVKYLEITFQIVCEQKNIIDRDTFIARHDLLAALLLREFDWTNIFGPKVHCVEDKESIVDNKFACRTLVFQQITDNNLVKSVGSTKMINREIHT